MPPAQTPEELMAATWAKVHETRSMTIVNRVLRAQDRKRRCQQVAEGCQREVDTLCAELFGRGLILEDLARLLGVTSNAIRKGIQRAQGGGGGVQG